VLATALPVRRAGRQVFQALCSYRCSALVTDLPVIDNDEYFGPAERIALARCSA